jgi:CheY-like chemotaxis protein
MLAKEGHLVETANDGLEALDWLTQAPAAFDLLITDHHMPGMNGLELVGRLRTLRFPGQIVVFSSELSEEITAAYHRLRVDCILPKPVFPATLRAVLAGL